MKKIGILGGTFDPIHNIHIRNALLAYQQLGLDEVWIVPVLNNPFNKTIVATNEQRVEMINLAIQPFPFIKLCDFELKQNINEKSYTYNTILAFKEKLDANYYLIIGYDQALKFDHWYKAKELSKIANIVVITRQGYPQPQCYHTYNMKELHAIPSNTSSSAIRDGKCLDLDDQVLKYMMMHSIYTKTMIKSKMSEKRYLHTLSMTELACNIAKSNQLDQEKAKVAGLLHDIAKEIPYDKAKKIMCQHYPQFIDSPVQIWHQWISAFIAKTVYKIDDQEILQAISNHTTGSVNMSKLDMCIYCADQYDPFRGYDSKKQIELCYKNIKLGFKQALIDFLEYANQKNQKIDPIFNEIYEKYVR